MWSDNTVEKIAVWIHCPYSGMLLEVLRYIRSYEVDIPKRHHDLDLYPWGNPSTRVY